MSTRNLSIFLTLFFAASLSACQQVEPQEEAAIPNPASVYCLEQGGRVEIREDAAGGQYGLCIFPDGSECEEWAFYRGECQPGGTQSSVPIQEPAADPAQPADEWQVYQYQQAGYRFNLPPGAVVEVGDDPLRSLTISGTSAAEEFWPQISLSHPADRGEFRPPEGTDLENWLESYNLLAGERMPDRIIAGATAIHLRHNRSPQSFANDRYFFLHDGQLYMLVIGHVADQEDWVIYDRFIDSIAFED